MSSCWEGIDFYCAIWTAMLTSTMRLPLQTLPAFRAVARLGNLRAAAEELHLTHSAVSQQIKLLEEQLGFEVFDRPGRRIVLNAAGEALLRSAAVWEEWFALAGVRRRVNPVATFNDAGMMLQAAEQDLGLALGRELWVADALRDGRLIRLSPIALAKDPATYALWLAYPSNLRDWPPLRALRAWLHAELKRSERELRAV